MEQPRPPLTPHADENNPRETRERRRFARIQEAPETGRRGRSRQGKETENAYREDATLVADLRLGIERGRIGVSVFAENVADARRNEQFVGPPASGRPYAPANPNQRRLIGATVEARF